MGGLQPGLSVAVDRRAGQRYGAQATLSDGSAIDQKNRRVFEEQMDLVLKAWTQDSVEFDGRVQPDAIPL